MKYSFIREHRKIYSQSRMCNVLDVSSSGYYDWIDRPESLRSVEYRRMKKADI